MEYNVRVASRYFKGPELLLDYQVRLLNLIKLKIKMLYALIKIGTICQENLVLYICVDLEITI